MHHHQLLAVRARQFPVLLRVLQVELLADVLRLLFFRGGLRGGGCIGRGLLLFSRIAGGQRQRGGQDQREWGCFHRVVFSAAWVAGAWFSIRAATASATACGRSIIDMCPQPSSITCVACGMRAAYS